MQDNGIKRKPNNNISLSIKNLYFVIVTRRMTHQSSHRYVGLLSVDKYKIRPLIITQFSATSYRINEVSIKLFTLSFRSPVWGLSQRPWSLEAREPQDTMKNLTKLTLAHDQFLYTVDN